MGRVEFGRRAGFYVHLDAIVRREAQLGQVAEAAAVVQVANEIFSLFSGPPLNQGCQRSIDRANEVSAALRAGNVWFHGTWWPAGADSKDKRVSKYPFPIAKFPSPTHNMRVANFMAWTAWWVTLSGETLKCPDWADAANAWIRENAPGELGKAAEEQGIFSAESLKDFLGLMDNAEADAARTNDVNETTGAVEGLGALMDKLGGLPASIKQDLEDLVASFKLKERTQAVLDQVSQGGKADRSEIRDVSATNAKLLDAVEGFRSPDPEVRAISVEALEKLQKPAIPTEVVVVGGATAAAGIALAILL